MDALGLLAATPVAAALKASATLYLLVNAAHILSIGLVVGAVVPMDLRLMGFFGHLPAAMLGPFLARAAAAGVVLAIVTGFCLFSVRPQHYAANPAFLVKMALLALGIANALTLRRSAAWRAMATAGRLAPSLRLRAGVSLVIWISAVLAGRWIAFV
ncbi:DUF2214 domain-containing protein [Rhizobium sp. TRM95111]|uniref:DUF2214 domain-containing protein n=1 Tax=Rhizobium alarense TaxID=2846851 RepID=UPI001F46BA27|nr:DUF2214 domain-containing protein [Rhizobium alarense]MCF3638502.1 DUF2214 domain-containing protein [Rhizobium alarense]